MIKKKTILCRTNGVVSGNGGRTMFGELVSKMKEVGEL
jgi:hypothetical protein